jgi:hypothetical protein
MHPEKGTNGHSSRRWGTSLAHNARARRGREPQQHQPLYYWPQYGRSSSSTTFRHDEAVQRRGRARRCVRVLVDPHYYYLLLMIIDAGPRCAVLCCAVLCCAVLCCAALWISIPGILWTITTPKNLE